MKPSFSGGPANWGDQLPERPREHEQEDLSRVAFGRALGASMVVRDVVRDYGLDVQVEIFEAGQATGRMFWVQLKATEEPLPKGLSEPFKVEQLAYYAEQADPVLLVRYHTPTDQLFAKWFHREEVNVARNNQKTRTIRWSTEQELTRASAVRLPMEVARFRAFRSATPAMPLRLRVRSVGEIEAGPTESELVLRLQALLRYAADAISIAGHELQSPVGEILITATGVTIDLTVASATLPRDPQSGPTSFARDVCVVLGLCLDLAGQPDLSARLLEPLAAEAELMAELEVALRVVSVFSRSRRVREAVDLAKRLESRDSDTAEVGQLLFVSVLARSATLTPGESQALAGYVRERTQRLAGKPHAAAAAAYTEGNHLFHVARDYPSAKAAYERALSLDSSYGFRRYFCGEIAGAYFENREYMEAAAWYARALMLSPSQPDERGDDKDGAFLADALMFAGHFRQARDTFELFVSGYLGPDRLWKLKLRGLVHAMTLLNVEEQVRSPEEAELLLFSQGDEPTLDLATEALHKDALLADGWYWRAVRLAEEGNYQDAAEALSLAGTISANPANMAEVFVLAINVPDRTLAVDVLAAEHFHNEGLFAEALAETMLRYPTDVREPMLSLIREELGKLPTRDDHLIVRYGPGTPPEDQV